MINNDLIRLLKAERDKLTNMIEQVEAGYDLRPADTVEPQPSKRSKFSPEARRRISAKSKAYWTARRESRVGRPRKTEATTPVTTPRRGFRGKVHWTQTPEGRKRMASISAQGRRALSRKMSAASR